MNTPIVSEMWSSVKNKGNNQDTFLVSLGVVLVWANAIHFSDLQISASKAQPVLFTFQLVQFLPLQHAFVFLFPFLPLAPNFTPVTAFHLSVFLLHCAMNCLLTFSDFFRISRLSVVHLPRLSLSLSPCVSHSLWQFRGCPCGTPDRSCHQLSPRPGQPGIWDARTRHRRVKSCQYEYYSKLSLPLFILTSPAALTFFLTSGSRHDISPAHKHSCLSASNTHNFEIF